MAAALSGALALSAWSGVLAAAWKELVGLITVRGEPVPASPAVISGHEVDELERLPPQAQAERLLERAVNHYDGAAELIEERIDGWRGKLAMEGRLNAVFTTAMNANDLRVRAAAIELYLAAYDIEKTPEALEQFVAQCDREDGGRPHALWVVGLLGNRGVDPRRALDALLRFVRDPDVEIRHWAVEGIAMLGTTDAIAPLLSAFHDDASPFVRERAACGLAQSGMLTASQRWTAIPELIGFSDDPALDETTRGWAVQALQDITGERWPKDARDWRAWWAKEPQPAASVTR